ncbi:MAG: multidrug effflux MFS transporter [Acidimicrobiales bacterium]
MSAVHPTVSPITASAPPPARGQRGVAGRREFIGLMAGCMGLTAFGIDATLPAFGEMRQDFGLGEGSTSVASVITAYFLGLAFGQLFYGPLSDRVGRKPMFYVGLSLYALAAVGSALAPSLAVLVVFRFLWGLGAAGPRSLALAMVRDRFAGDQMARTMSFVMAVFIMVPVLAPSMGAVVLRWWSWPAVFWMGVVMAGVMLVWSRRLPETLPPERRRNAGAAELLAASKVVVRSRPTVAYGLAATCLFGSMAAYLGNSEIIIDKVYGRGPQFPLIFGALALTMGAATLLNARLVVGLGLRLLLRRVGRVLVAATSTFAVISVATGGDPPFWVFCAMMAMLLPLHTTALPNCNTAAMTPLGKVAGMGAALLGTFTTAGGALLGSLVDRLFNGSTTPLAVAMTIFALVAATLIHLADIPVAAAPAAPGLA